MISELRQLNAGDARKALVAHLLRERTAMSSRWIAQAWTWAMLAESGASLIECRRTPS